MNNFLSGSLAEQRHEDYGISTVLGNNWGDEGKGKITDSLTERSDIITRFQGGHNAGHTVKVGDKKFDLHILPSGMVSPGKINFIASGCVLGIYLPKIQIDKMKLSGDAPIINHKLSELLRPNTRVGLIPELENLKKGGIDIQKSGLHISLETPIIGIHNILLDAFDEQSRIASNLRPIGSTGSGISRSYAGVSQRYHFSLHDLLYTPDNYYNSIRALWLSSFHNFPNIHVDELIEYAKNEREMILKYIQDGTITLIDNEKEFLQLHYDQGKKILGEGAQSALIGSSNSIYGTASSPNIESFINVTGLKEKNIGNAFLVNKFPHSSVGTRPQFLAHQDSQELDDFRKKYDEFGVSTGRPRDIFRLSAFEMAHSTSLIIGSLLDESKIVPVVNRMDAVEDYLQITGGKVPVATGYQYLQPSLTGDEKLIQNVGVTQGEDLSRTNLTKGYPQRSQQEELFGVKEEYITFKNIEGTVDEISEKILGVIVASTFNGNQNREIVIGTGPERKDLEMRHSKPLRQL